MKKVGEQERQKVEKKRISKDMFGEVFRKIREMVFLQIEIEQLFFLKAVAKTLLCMGQMHMINIKVT